jgi:dTDP-4-amino-4,6-dideoxygalactose transaminase
MLGGEFEPWPCFSEEEVKIVGDVLASNRVNYWTGDQGKNFEKEFAVSVTCQHAVAVANGTLALELALRGLQITAGDEVVVTPRTFVATASSVVAVGATPVFADVDKNSGNITAETISAVLSPKTKAVICVHLAGMPCEMDGIMELAEVRGLFVVEDCAQAHGAKYKGRPVGSIGHVGAWSFCQDKIMTTGGEGGMVTTNSAELWERMWSYKDHGKDWGLVSTPSSDKGFRWLHTSFGTNWRLTEMQAAIGRYQLTQLSHWTEQRQHNASVLDVVAKRFKALRLVSIPDYVEHAEYKHYYFVNHTRLNPGWTRDRIVEEIKQLGVPCFQGSCSEVYREQCFEGVDGTPKTPLPIAKELGESSLMFLVHPSLTSKSMTKMANALSAVMSQASA